MLRSASLTRRKLEASWVKIYAKNENIEINVVRFSNSGLMFETIEGGFLDIDVRIVGPDGKVIYQVSPPLLLNRCGFYYELF